MAVNRWTGEWELGIHQVLTTSKGVRESFSLPTGKIPITDREQYTKGSLVAQTVKNLPAVQETWIQSLGWEDPLEERMWQPTQYSCLGNSHGQKSLAGYSPWGHKESDTTELLSTAHETHVFRKADFWKSKEIVVSPSLRSEWSKNLEDTKYSNSEYERWSQEKRKQQSLAEHDLPKNTNGRWIKGKLKNIR